MLTDLLKPFENYIHTNFQGSWIHDMFFQLFRWMHLYYYEYVDYLLFCIIVLPLFYISPKKARPYLLLASSFILVSFIYGFYFTLLLALIPYGFYLLTMRLRQRAIKDRTFRKKAITYSVAAILVLYGLLLARESFEWAPIIPFLGKRFSIPLLHVAGVAFMVPKLIHFVVENLRGNIKRSSTLGFLLFILFFPILRMGPIESYIRFNKDFEKSSTDGVKKFDIYYGIFRIVLGVVKTFFYAGLLYPMRQKVPSILDGMSLWHMYYMFFIIVIEVYFHFGGYTDIAVGVSRLLGFRMTENFYLPFFSPNIGEWWRRWHISLSFWLRNYVYLPLGGGRFHAYRNYLVTFVICGAWHYISWNYIIWGAMQGIGLAILRLWKIFWWLTDNRKGFCDWLKPLVGFMKQHPRLSYSLATIFTIHYFCLSGVYFIFNENMATKVIIRLIKLSIF